MTAVGTSGNGRAELYCPICEQQFDDGVVCPTDGYRLVRLTNQIDPFLGRELDGRFTITERLGQGGMGSVYRARQHSVSREIAIKVIHPGMVSDPQSIKRFLREAKIASKLAHPNVVAVMDFGQASDGVFWLAMELVEGRTLQDVLATDGPFSVVRLVRVGVQILDALEGAHGIPIVHRDLKPANVMLLAQGRDLVKVLDFGLAKSLALDATNNTMTGALLGTPAFMPPELANGESCDGRADLYSLGCILFMLGTGRPPFETDSVPEMIAMHGTLEAPPMIGVPQPIAEVVGKLLAKRPGDRYSTAADARRALEAAYEETRVSGAELEDVQTRQLRALPPRGSPNAGAVGRTMVVRPGRRRSKRSLLPWLLGGGALLGAVIGIAVGLSGGTHVTPARPPTEAPADTVPAVPRSPTVVEQPSAAEDPTAGVLDVPTDAAVDAPAYREAAPPVPVRRAPAHGRESKPEL